jgi:hypothetical protein
VDSSFLHRLVHPYPSTSRRYLYLSAGGCQRRRAISQRQNSRRRILCPVGRTQRERGTSTVSHGMLKASGRSPDTAHSGGRAVGVPLPSHSRKRRLLVNKPRPDDRIDQVDTAVKVSRAIWERVLPVWMTHDEARAPAALHAESARCCKSSPNVQTNALRGEVLARHSRSSRFPAG